MRTRQRKWTTGPAIANTVGTIRGLSNAFSCDFKWKQKTAHAANPLSPSRNAKFCGFFVTLNTSSVRALSGINSPF
jgi:hypothetical protein